MVFFNHLILSFKFESKGLEQRQLTLFKVERASWVAQLVKNLPAMQETLIQFLGREVPLEKG